MACLVMYTPPSESDIVNCTVSNRGKQHPNAACVLDNLVPAKLALAEYAVDKCDGHLTDGVSERLCAHHHFHLEDVALRLGHRDDVP